jgi:hypothetical protein
VTAGRADDDRHLSRPHASDPMPQHRPFRPERTPGGAVEFSHYLEGGTLVDLVIQRDDPGSSRPLGPHSPREQDHSAEARALELSRGGREGERPTGQPDRHRQPPPYGGWTANSSPSRTRTVRRVRYRPFRTNRLALNTGAIAGYAAARSRVSDPAGIPSSGTGQSSSARPTAVRAVENRRTRADRTIRQPSTINRVRVAIPLRSVRTP